MAEPPPSAPWTAPSPPSPPPSAWTPRPPKARRRRPWIYLLIGAVVVILGLAIASGTVWITKLKPPIDAANDYLRDLSDSNYDRAFDQLCPAEQVDASPERLAGVAVELDIDEYEVTPFDVDRDGSRATVKVDLSPDDFGSTDRFVRMRLEEIDGEWRPCGPLYGFEFARTSD